MKLAATAGVLLLLLVGVLLGRVTAPSSTSTTPTPSDAAHPDPGPTSETAGVGVGFADSREGAVAAVAEYQQAFATKDILRPGELERRIDLVATPGFAPLMIEANEPGTERLKVGPLGEGVRGQIPTAYFGVPIGYRVVSYSSQQAVILVWGFTLIGNVSSVEPVAYFGLSRTSLEWREGDWKIADTKASFGPTPNLGTKRQGSELGLVELTQELQPYEVTP